MFVIEGHRNKTAGEHPDRGVYFVSAADAAQRVKTAGRLAENTAGKIIGIIPGLAAGLVSGLTRLRSRG